MTFTHFLVKYIFQNPATQGSAHRNHSAAAKWVGKRMGRKKVESVKEKGYEDVSSVLLWVEVGKW